MSRNYASPYLYEETNIPSDTTTTLSTIVNTHRRRSGSLRSRQREPPAGWSGALTGDEVFIQVLQAITIVITSTIHFLFISLTLYAGNHERTQSPLRQLLLALLMKDAVMIGKLVVHISILRADAITIPVLDLLFSAATTIFDICWFVLAANVVIFKADPNDARQAPLLYWVTLGSVVVPVCINIFLVCTGCHFLIVEAGSRVFPSIGG